MPVIVLDHAVPLPARELERCLNKAAPAYHWRVGDDPEVSALSLDRPVIAMGLAGPDVIMMAIELRRQPLPLDAGAPPHQVHIFLSEPSTDQTEIARRVALLAAATILEGTNGFAQLVADGPWFDARELGSGKQKLLHDPARADVGAILANAGERHPSAASAAAAMPSAAAIGGLPPPGSPAERMMMSDLDHSFARILTEVGGAEFTKQMGYAPPPTYADEEPRADRLPTFVLALDRPLEFDWAPALEIGRLDPAGNWQVQPGPKGTGTLTGRGCTVTIEMSADPIPRYMLANALARSFWFKPGASAFAGHTCSLVVRCDLDTRAVPFEDVRETAIVVTLLLGLLTRSPGCVALLNNGIHTLLDPEMVQSQVAHLHDDQIPLMLWTWTAPDSLVKDSVSLSTGGVLPFLGYEVEVWNAPGEPDWVGDKLARILNYLLRVGPVVHDGDPFGEREGDRSIRGFFGTTRAERADKHVKVLLLEFDNPPGAKPLPDTLPPSPEARAVPRPTVPAAAFPRGARFFGRRGT